MIQHVVHSQQQSLTIQHLKNYCSSLFSHCFCCHVDTFLRHRWVMLTIHHVNFPYKSTRFFKFPQHLLLKMLNTSDLPKNILEGIRSKHSNPSSRRFAVLEAMFARVLGRFPVVPPRSPTNGTPPNIFVTVHLCCQVLAFLL